MPRLALLPLLCVAVCVAMPVAGVAAPSPTLLWKVALPPPVGLDALPSGDLLASPGDNSTLRLSAASGATVWKWSNGTAPYLQAVNPKSGDVYLVINLAGDNTPPYNATVFAIDGDAGTVRWEYAAPMGCCGTWAWIDSLLSDGNRVYVTTYPGALNNVTAFSAGNGTVLWGVGIGSDGPPGEALWLQGDIALSFVEGGGTLFAVNTNNGSLVWQWSEDEHYMRSVVARGVVFSSMVEVSVTDPQSFLTAFDIVTGAANFMFTSDANSEGEWFLPVPSQYDPLAFTYDRAQQMVVNVTNGNVLWNCSTCGNYFNQPPKFSPDGTFYVVTANSTLLAYVGTTGAEMWSRPNTPVPLLFPLPTIALTTPASGMGLVALNSSTGAVLWELALPANITTSLLDPRDNATVFVGSGSVVAAVSVNTGVYMWLFDAPDAVASLLFSVDRLIVSSVSGGVYAVA